MGHDPAAHTARVARTARLVVRRGGLVALFGRGAGAPSTRSLRRSFADPLPETPVRSIRSLVRFAAPRVVALSLWTLPLWTLSLSLLPRDLAAQATFPSGAVQGPRWRHIGPFRAGRTKSAVGVPSQPNVFYMAATNGGV